MDEVPEPDMRIGDADRESALKALGEHMSAGRLTVDEYGERSAQVTAAKTRRELAGLFGDLPAPHPVLGEPPKQAAVPAPKRSGPVAYTDRPLGQRVAAAVLPLLFVGAIVLGLTTHLWWFIAVPFVFGAVGQGLWGKDWDKDRHHGRDRHRGHRWS
ncbi:DUF1707 SHOCT-like domain-containing protein [Amycolatopsis alkalitolerans]|uniref:DUF1707 domain-containing protein n=1 Tax=Amycolatopsis alkalitolerans TaxID=2547244 RepID=A0A5C4LSP7_9PSEU|nr:DUF1707 domain-containing protein [Amycolatopsis alkalitolerans]TNC20684.1 DUF1707 domain-containing protein [Amycolatopsis alkalitolerans]